jgi:hypothetical protein
MQRISLLAQQATISRFPCPFLLQMKAININRTPLERRQHRTPKRLGITRGRQNVKHSSRLDGDSNLRTLACNLATSSHLGPITPKTSLAADAEGSTQLV